MLSAILPSSATPPLLLILLRWYYADTATLWVIALLIIATISASLRAIIIAADAYADDIYTSLR